MDAWRLEQCLVQVQSQTRQLCQEAFLVIPLERRQGSRKPPEQFQGKVEDWHLERKAGWNLIHVENRLSGPKGEKEIGRASCRERVCLYV